MLILSRFNINDELSGYELDDAGLKYSVTERGLYDKDILEGLVASGYKIMDYHGTIITPEGICIKDMVAEVCTATESELQNMMDMADYVLTEAEATRYFSHDVEIKEISLKEPKVMIHTRDELVEYLNKVSISMKYATAAVDVRPLNSFVAREALFTVEELVASAEVKECFRIIEARRKLNSYNSYKELIKFLQAEGVLKNEYTPDDVKAAYLSWGICGLKTPITDTYVKVGVTSSIYTINEQIDKFDTTVGRTKEYCLLDKEGTVHYLGGKAPLIDSENFETEIVSPVNDEDYWNAMHSTARWEDEYKAIPCFVTRPKTRTYYKLMDESGLSFRVKVDLNRIVIVDMRNVLYVGEFLHVKCMDGGFATLDRVATEESYVRWNLTRAKARDLIKAKTTKPPVDNSFSLCVEEGVVPDNAINYIARRITDNKELNGDFQDGINYFDAADMYKAGPDKDLIRKYNPDGIEYESVDELIDIMCATREELIEEGDYLNLSKQDKSIGAQSIREEMQIRPLEQLEFARNCKEGRIVIDFLGAGLQSDGMVDVTEIADLLELMIRKRTGDAYLNIDSVINILSSIEALDDVIRERDSAFKGYLKDRAHLNASRANQCAAAVYITRIYREAANVPIEDQRHFMFDCISLDLQDKKRSKAVMVQREITSAIEAAFKERKDIPYTYREACLIEAPSIALKLMFKIALQKAHINSREEGFVIVGEQYAFDGESGVTLSIKIPSDIYQAAGDTRMYDGNKCCTLYDWCQLEMTSLAFNLYCLNANITPWKVIPKAGVKIPTYNFALNFMYHAALGKLSQGYQDKVKSENAKVQEFINTYISNNLIEGDLLDEATSYTLETIDGVLHRNANESIANYRERFLLHNKEAVAKGMYLKRMRLKADVIYKAFADKFNSVDIGDEEDIYEPLTDDSMKNLWITTTTPGIADIGISDKMLTGPQNVVTDFVIPEEKFSDIIRWIDLIYDRFVPNAVCILNGNKLVCAGPTVGKKIFDLRSITREEATQMVNQGIFYQLNAREFLLLTSAGKVRLEINNA